ncbi:ATP:ADP antiporter, AAA family [Fistulifera solaris]|uniref:ADP,ATP carrier protein n=1 Tax=Fistulifera solaris TaxID=1519565 RepID=A0A1Z5KDS3_FISSO|nr:ATP:ADP antiporter, AAA family [Fistulifera solaris]|eukprot:GAX24285.1 ATP:ADP antiporter, AAA family [Fistulifera solaris]
MRTIHSLITAGGLLLLCSSNAFLAPANASRQAKIFSRSALPHVRQKETTKAPNNRASSSKLAATAERIPEESSGSKWRRRIQSLIPEPQERKKLLPLAIMFFFIIFNYTILRDTKDVLLVTAPKSGAEVIPFIKTYVNLPVAIGFATLYVKLTEWFDHKNIFYVCVTPFLTFFTLFATVLYPMRDILHPHVFIDAVASQLPLGFAAPLAIVRNWSFSMFYVLAEMWGSVVASLLFWGFANEITTVDEAKKYYPLFGLGANVALILAGQYNKWVSRQRLSFGPEVDAWGMSLRFLMGAVLASGGIIVGCYKHIQDNVVPTLQSTKDAAKAAASSPPPKERKRMTMRESFDFLRNSPYIRNLAVLVISYGLAINIVEVSWKSKLKQAFPDPNSYSSFMGNFSSATGVVTLVMMLVGRVIFQKFGWRTAAMITPTVLGATGLGFFGLSIFRDALAPITAALGTTPLMLAVLLGAVQNIACKASKYSLFDPCKEMAYIPLDKDSKTKGKAAIDVAGMPLGKGGGALLQQILIFGLGSLEASTPVLAVVLAAVVYFWLRSAQSLADQFDAAMSRDNK